MRTNKLFLWIIIAVALFFHSLSAISASSNLLVNTFDSKQYHYLIHYPANWKLRDLGKGVVVFNSKSKNPPYSLSVNIQTIYTKKAGGHYKSVKDLMDDFRSQVPIHTKHAKFLERKPITLPQSDGIILTGEQAILTFYENGQTFKHWQVMLMSRDGNLFQAWAYRAPLQYFDINYSLAAAMLTSWEIS